jgi:hypothetical protein
MPSVRYRESVIGESMYMDRSQWPHSLKRVFAAVRLLGSWV